LLARPGDDFCYEKPNVGGAAGFSVSVGVVGGDKTTAVRSVGGPARGKPIGKPKEDIARRKEEREPIEKLKNVVG
jgi:hypothetical protein